MTDETRQVLNSGQVKSLAKEYGCDPSYIYQMLSGFATDPFAPFEAFLTAAVDAGMDVTPWITRQKIILERRQLPSKELNISTVTAEYGKESNDVPCGHIKGDSLEDQLAEIQQANAKGADLERALIHAINERDGKHLYNGKVYDGLRRAK